MTDTDDSTYGVDHYRYHHGQRMRVGRTRTFRRAEYQASHAFRLQVEEYVREEQKHGTLEMDEDYREGTLVQVTVRLQMTPTPAPSFADDTRPIGDYHPRGRGYPHGRP